jgi:hypothetical protein
MHTAYTYTILSKVSEAYNEIVIVIINGFYAHFNFNLINFIIG